MSGVQRADEYVILHKRAKVLNLEAKRNPLDTSQHYNLYSTKDDSQMTPGNAIPRGA